MFHFILDLVVPLSVQAVESVVAWFGARPPLRKRSRRAADEKG